MRDGIRSARHLLNLVIVGLVVVFAIQNAATVEVQFLLWSTAMPRVVILFLFFAAGALVGWLAHRPSKGT